MTDSIKHIRRSLVSNTENKIELKIVHGKVPKWLNGIVRYFLTIANFSVKLM
jgi:hypothetical protein